MIDTCRSGIKPVRGCRATSRWAAQASSPATSADPPGLSGISLLRWGTFAQKEVLHCRPAGEGTFYADLIFDRNIRCPAVPRTQWQSHCSGCSIYVSRTSPGRCAPIPDESDEAHLLFPRGRVEKFKRSFSTV